MPQTTDGAVGSPETYQVIEVDPANDARWDEFVRRNAGSFYHLSVWKEILQRTYHYRPLYLAAETRDGDLCGLLPLFLVQSRLTGTKLVSIPFSDIGGPLATTQEALRALIEHALALRETYRARYLQIRTRGSVLASWEPRLTPDPRYVDFVLQLPRDAEDVWSRSSFATVRRNVRKANQKGITVHEGHAERELAEFYELHLKTTKKHGMPAQKYRYFQNFWQLLPRDCDVHLLLARQDGRAVAASLFVGFGDCVQYVYGASEPSALPLGANYLVIWEAIRLACARGYRRFTLGKTSRENEGLLCFKRRWGADEIPLTYYYHPAVDGTTSSAYTERSLKYHVVTGLWRALPAPVTDRVGGLLYGHLA